VTRVKSRVTLWRPLAPATCHWPLATDHWPLATRPLPLRPLLVLLAVVSTVLPLSAREKTDVIILKNGDHISCEIKRLARGILTVGTDSTMDSVRIKWQDIKTVTSKFLFTLEDDQGQIYVGSLEPAGEVGRLTVVGPQPGNDLDHLSIVKIQALEENHWKRFSGSADLSYSFTKASDRQQFNFSGDILYRTERYSGQLTYSSTIGTSNGETDQDRQLITMVGTREFSGRWLAYTQTSFSTNLELQLDGRFTALGGPGYNLIQSNSALIRAIGAAAYTNETYSEQETQQSAEGFFMIDSQFFKLYSPKVDVINQLAYLPSFSKWGRHRLEYYAKARIEVLRDFFVTVTFYDSYDSDPPSETAVRNDYGFTTGLSWSFRK